MNYVRKLGFEETPDYDYLRGLFDKVLQRMGEKEDNVFDWMIELEKQRNELTRVREKQKPNTGNSNQLLHPQQQPQKASNLSVPGNAVNESMTQNASMQVLRGGVDSVDEMANASNSQNLVDSQPINPHKEVNINSPLNKEIKIESSNQLNEEKNKNEKNNENEDSSENEEEKIEEKIEEKKEEEKKEIEKLEPEIEKKPTLEQEKEFKPELEKEPPKSTPAVVTNEPAATAQPTPASASAINANNNNNNNNNDTPPKKKSKGFFLFSCCTSSN